MQRRDSRSNSNSNSDVIRALKQRLLNVSDPLTLMEQHKTKEFFGIVDQVAAMGGRGREREDDDDDDDWVPLVS